MAPANSLQPKHYAKHLCEMSGEQVANRASATAQLVDWFLAEVAA